MKLLFDQNISHRIISKLDSKFLQSKQVRELKLESTPDIDIWRYAKENDFTIVTFDADFIDIANMNGHPPKIIWLRIGNSTANKIADLILNKANEIEEFIQGEKQSNIACLEIN